MRERTQSHHTGPDGLPEGLTWACPWAALRSLQHKEVEWMWLQIDQEVVSTPRVAPGTAKHSWGHELHA